MRRFNALPIGFDFDVIFFLNEDGGIFRWDPPPDELCPVDCLWVELVVLRLATSHFPELIGALPRRPGVAVDCTACAGLGFVDRESPEARGLKDWPCRLCGTLGWYVGEPLCP